VPLAALAGTAERVLAHGGEDHGPPAAPTAGEPIGSALRLPLESQFLLEVRTERALAGPFDERVPALGTAVAPPGGSAEIHAPVTGILSLPPGSVLAPGQLVTAGEPLATISETLAGADRSSVVAGQSEAMIRLAEARRDLAVAERDAARAEELGAVLSERERLERRSALELARQAVAQAEGATSQLRSGTPTTVLRAPIRGRISAMLARPGDVVSPGDVLYRLVGDGSLWIEARVPEALAGRLVAGAPALVWADARPDEPLAATVLDPGLEADPATGTLEVTLATEGTPSWLVPGMTVATSIVSGEVRQALTIPDGAVVDSGGETLVFVKTGPETFETRPVRVGALSADRREVLVGLAEGERVVVQGTYALRSLAGR
jgi:membrane fusion protein, heavy metal efflux system